MDIPAGSRRWDSDAPHRRRAQLIVSDITAFAAASREFRAASEIRNLWNLGLRRWRSCTKAPWSFDRRVSISHLIIIAYYTDESILPMYIYIVQIFSTEVY